MSILRVVDKKWLKELQAFLVLFYFVETVFFFFFFFFYKLKACGNPASTVLALFCQQHLLPSCLSHILVTLTIFQTFKLLYLLW